MTFGRSEGGGRRGAPREAASLLAVYTTVTKAHSALLVDVSSTGARLQTPDLPQEGEELFVTIGTVKAFGSVAWVREPAFAMAFEEPLRAEDLDILKDNIRAARGLPAELKAALDDWVLGTR